MRCVSPRTQAHCFKFRRQVAQHVSELGATDIQQTCYQAVLTTTALTSSPNLSPNLLRVTQPKKVRSG